MYNIFLNIFVKLNSFIYFRVIDYITKNYFQIYDNNLILIYVKTLSE